MRVIPPPKIFSPYIIAFCAVISSLVYEVLEPQVPPACKSTAGAEAKADVTKGPARFVIVSFLSMGPPFDEGLNLKEERELLKGIAGPPISDALYISSPFHLENDPWWRAFFRPYPDTPEWILPTNPGCHKVGYSKYKLLLLYRAMQMEPPGTIIMYMDGNVRKFPVLAAGREQWRELTR